MLTGYWYWGMTPYAYVHGYSLVSYIATSGGIKENNVNGVYLEMRPMVALIPSVTLTNTPNQDGTATHPFEIAIS